MPKQTHIFPLFALIIIDSKRFHGRPTGGPSAAIAVTQSALSNPLTLTHLGKDYGSLKETPSNYSLRMEAISCSASHVSLCSQHKEICENVVKSESDRHGNRRILTCSGVARNTASSIATHGRNFLVLILLVSRNTPGCNPGCSGNFQNFRK